MTSPAWSVIEGMPAEQEVATFIRGSFRSVWSLELIVLLRSDRARSWSSPDLVTALRGSDLVVRQSLDNLVAAGLVVVEEGDTARYQPVNDDVDALVAEAALLYGRRPDKVRRMIVAASASGLTAFADSFKLRRD